ncbi:hypothetical protein TSOC_003526, partial [Tetrabaena socialis]
PIPEDAELPSGGGTESWGPPPLEQLESDPTLDATWEAIKKSNQRPDTSVMGPAHGLDVFSRPATGALRLTRQAAPMVLILDDITASTPEVVARELAQMSLGELQALKAKLNEGVPPSRS